MEKAKRLLKHYFRTVFVKADLPWDSDNDAEIDEIVDSIYDSLCEEIAASEERQDSPAHQASLKK